MMQRLDCPVSLRLLCLQCEWCRRVNRGKMPRKDVPYLPKKGIKLCAKVYENTSLGPTTKICLVSAYNSSPQELPCL